MVLSDKEKSLLNRIAGQKNTSLTFSIVSVAAAVLLLLYYGFIARDPNSQSFVIVILVLLSGRAHLKQYRCAVLLNKLKLWIDRKDVYHETDAS